jgi:hypothetical protein
MPARQSKGTVAVVVVVTVFVVVQPTLRFSQHQTFFQSGHVSTA